MSKKKILITGSTNGIGNQLTNYYLDKGHKVLGVDRNENRNIKKNFNYEQMIVDITNAKKIEDFLNTLKKKNELPDIFILNAGINIYDNDDYFNLDNFKKCFDINFYGVFSFISFIEKNNLSGKKILFISSISIIIPNPKSLAYYSSKLLLKKLTPFLKNKNDYKVAILGPIRTDISRNINKPSGLANLIYKILVIEKSGLCNKLDKFLIGKGKKFYYPKKSFLIYNLILFFLYFFPFLYKG